MPREIIGDDADALLRAITEGDDDDVYRVSGREIVGEGEIGAIAARAFRAGQRQAKSPVPGPQGKGPDPRKWRRLPAPLPATLIASGATADVTIKPQRLFRPEFLIAQGTGAAKTMTIEGATVQGENQFVSSGSIPIEAFAATTLLNNEMQLKTADIGAEITLKVKNGDTVSATFTGTLFGEAYID